MWYTSSRKKTTTKEKTMARQTKEEKAIDKQVEKAYYKHFDCVQVNMMDLTKIMNVGRNALKEGRDLDEAMAAAVETFRVGA
jgi:hypothetical protein